MNSYGKQRFGKGGAINPISASSSPEHAKSGVIDWSTVRAAISRITLIDGTIIDEGEKFVRYGAVLVRIEVGESRGMYGPYDRDAVDGRQLIERSRALVLNRTVQKTDSDSVELFEGGSVFKARLLVGDEGDTNQPSWSDFNAAFPQLRFISD